MDLDEATTDEIYAELKKRNHTVVLCCARILDVDRIEIYQRSSGSWALLYGMIFERLLRDAATDVITRFSGDDDARGSNQSDDTMEQDDGAD